MNTYEKPLKVLVCGTNFGRVYLKGLERCGDKFKIAGIFSHGSTQSKQEAEKYGVPLITDLNEVSKKDFDMACVVIRSTAVGGKGTEIAGALLEKGIHVIQEHPVHYNDIVKLLKVAKENNCVYQVNSFYPNVKNVQEFIVKSNKLLKKSRPTWVTIWVHNEVNLVFPDKTIYYYLLLNEQSELNKTIIKKIGLYHQNILKKEYKGKSAELFEKKVDMI